MASPDLQTLSTSHASSISTILNHLYSAFGTHSILITNLTTSSISVNYATGTPEDYILHSKRTISLSPPLSSLRDAGARLDRMAAEFRLRPRRGRSSITIAEYRVPRGYTNAMIIAWGVLSTAVWPVVRSFIMGGNLYTDLSSLFRGEWLHGIPTLLSLITLVVHLVEAGAILAPKMYTYNIPFASSLWWKWYIGHIVGGMTSPWTLDELVAEEEKRSLAKTKKLL